MTREMKNSGVEWIGDIPREWKVENLQWNMNEIIEKNSPIKITSVLSLTKEKGVIPYEDKGNQGNKSKESIEDYKIAYKGTIVANSMNILIGSVGISNYDGCVSPVYYVFKNNNKTDLRFLNYIFTTEQFQKQLRKYANGILEIRLRVSSENIMKQKVMFPPLPEQTRIADFLDSKVAEIDKIISETKASIENYKEYKQSVITEAVTKGLDKNVVRKNCNIQWINEIPKHWSEKKILHITSMPVIDGPHVSPALYDDGIPYISADAIENGKINFDRKRGYISKEYSEECNKRYKPKENDILVVKLGASTGKMAIVGKETNFNIWVPLAVVRCKDNISPKFVFYCMTSQYFKNEIENGWTFGTQETLGIKTLEQLKICIPDNLQEQQEIVDFLDGRCVEIDYLISEKEKLITNLEEYKKSLIYEYVTGKKEIFKVNIDNRKDNIYDKQTD